MLTNRFADWANETNNSSTAREGLKGLRGLKEENPNKFRKFYVPDAQTPIRTAGVCRGFSDGNGAASDFSNPVVPAVGLTAVVEESRKNASYFHVQTSQTLQTPFLHERGGTEAIEENVGAIGEWAGVCEFDGSQDHAKGEAEAYKAKINRWLNSHPVASNPADGCAWCHKPETPDALLAAYGIGPHAWLHPACWPAWSSTRRAEAKVALSAVGVPMPRGPVDVPETMGPANK